MAKERIVIGEEELADAPPDGTAPSAHREPPAAPQRPAAPKPPSLPPVGSVQPRPVGVGGPGSSGAPPTVLNDPRWSPLIAAAIGILIGWALSEIVGISDSIIENATADAILGKISEGEYQHRIRMGSGVWTGIIGLAFGIVCFCFDRVMSGAWEEAGRRAARAAIPLFVAGFASGYLAQWIYAGMAPDLGESGEGKAYLARAIGWAIFGGGIGLAIGLIDKSRQRAINGLLGGLAGGAVGGIVFEYLGRSGTFGEGGSRFFGLLAVGLGIALAIRLVEAARREAWLRIVAGGMSGKEFIVYHEVTRIGASPECEIFLLKDPAVEKLHAQVLDRDGRRTLTALGPVTVNGTPVREKQLQSGDQIQIGATTISYSERVIS